MIDSAYKMRTPCKWCDCTDGRIVPCNGQDVVRCLKCDRANYNAPKKETGKPQTHVDTREGIKASVRAMVLVRANATCELCHRSTTELHVSHLLSVESGRLEGLSDEQLNSQENLAAMCAACNLGLGRMPVPLWLAMAIVMARTKALARQAGLNL